jgi:hypothetical protein
VFKLKLYAFIVLVIIIIAVALFFSPGMGNAFNRNAETKVSVHTVARRYLEKAQMISLHCKYDDVFELSEDKLKNIYGMSIPGTEKHVIIKTQGTVYLGIDCKEITVDTTRSDTLFMTFPPIKIIAQEFEFTNIYDMSGVFRKYNLKELPELRNNYRAEMESHVKNDWTAISMAETAMERAFKNDIPNLKDVPIVFSWAPTARNISIGIKRETPVELKWEIPEK